MADALQRALPMPFPAAVEVLRHRLPPPLPTTQEVASTFGWWPLCTLAERHGLEHSDVALPFLRCCGAGWTTRTPTCGAREAGVTTEIEVYPANHGWCALDSPVYDEAQAERAWARLLATYEAHL